MTLLVLLYISVLFGIRYRQVRHRRFRWVKLSNFSNLRSLRWVKGVGLGYGRQLYFHCLLKYMVICAFENSPSILSFLETQKVYIRYGQILKKWLFFLLPFYNFAPCLFIPPLPGGGEGYTVLPLSVLPSVQDIFSRIFLRKY